VARQPRGASAALPCSRARDDHHHSRGEWRRTLPRYEMRAIINFDAAAVVYVAFFYTQTSRTTAEQAAGGAATRDLLVLLRCRDHRPGGEHPVKHRVTAVPGQETLCAF